MQFFASYHARTVGGTHLVDCSDTDWLKPDRAYPIGRRDTCHLPTTPQNLPRTMNWTGKLPDDVALAYWSAMLRGRCLHREASAEKSFARFYVRSLNRKCQQSSSVF